MVNELIINGKPVKIIEYKGQRVITTAEMAEHHGLEVRILNQKFRRNRKHFIEGSDFYIVEKSWITNCDHDIKMLFTQNNMNEIFLFTESGYLRFVKTINDDKAWEIYGQLIDAYFKSKRLDSVEKVFLGKSKAHRKGLCSEWAEHDAKNYAKLTVSEYDALFQNKKIRKKDMDDSQLSLLSAFEFLEGRKLQNNPDILGDAKLTDSLAETGLKVIDIIKQRKQIN